MFVVESVEDLWDHIAYVMAYAAVGFPHRDFAPDGDQMTLDRAFEQLRHGVDLAYPNASEEAHRSELNAILDESYAAYRAGEDIKAGHLLNKFQDGIFKR